ncbi:hypothetical protein F3Y22_tig00109906pilonHSYRG00035 [Hibiscus syriacus]|uniref:Uncharacterized protein n=1 Tax=Hibiscus syriacus TaxID=106335 RepID=A0A6A3BW73_HIBSY|nr:hypothetical protein F3Y22_tig00109906pilonHSYRG00035 [Hibiscus syriacus]
MDAEVDMSVELRPTNKILDLEDMKRRLREIEEEAGALREMQAKVEKEMGSVLIPQVLLQVKLKRRKWIPARFMLVDYACTPEEVQQHFQSCGTVSAKRTNIPGMKEYRGRPNPYFARRPFMPGPASILHMAMGKHENVLALFGVGNERKRIS